MIRLKPHKESSSRAQGTSFTGTLKATYAELTELFGESLETDGYKTDAEWHVSITVNGEDAGFATIYNYKDGKNYLGANGLNVEDIDEWHVGSKTKWDLWNLEEGIIAERETKLVN